jgi:hypothetical protein
LQLWLHLDQICISAEPLWWARMTSKGSHKVVLYSASRSSTHQVLLQNHQCSMDRTETCDSTPCYPMHNSHNFNVSDNQDTQARTMSKLFQKSFFLFFISVSTHWSWLWSLKLKLTCCMQAYNTNSVHQNARVPVDVLTKHWRCLFTRLALALTSMNKCLFLSYKGICYISTLHYAHKRWHQLNLPKVFL